MKRLPTVCSPKRKLGPVCAILFVLYIRFLFSNSTVSPVHPCQSKKHKRPKYFDISALDMK